MSGSCVDNDWGEDKNCSHSALRTSSGPPDIASVGEAEVVWAACGSCLDKRAEVASDGSRDASEEADWLRPCTAGLDCSSSTRIRIDYECCWVEALSRGRVQC
jgi:hypothetical protein